MLPAFRSSAPVTGAPSALSPTMATGPRSYRAWGSQKRLLAACPRPLLFPKPTPWVRSEGAQNKTLGLAGCLRATNGTQHLHRQSCQLSSVRTSSDTRGGKLDHKMQMQMGSRGRTGSCTASLLARLLPGRSYSAFESLKRQHPL